MGRALTAAEMARAREALRCAAEASVAMRGEGARRGRGGHGGRSWRSRGSG
jgi:hypothetical protein